MTMLKSYLISIFLGTLTAGIALAQAPEGKMMGDKKNNMMEGKKGSQMMTMPMMNPEMMRGMCGTMNQMHQMMQQMAGTLEHHGHSMDMKSMDEMAKMMADMGGMMHNMATHMRDGKMDAAMLKTMKEQMDTMGKSLKCNETTQKTKK